MIELRLLGSVELTGSDGKELTCILRQPKRLALLAYLAIAHPRGFHRRDTLLALFWPDSSIERGRDALNRSLYMLRRALGEGVVLSRGEEVGVAPERLWCDVAAFEDARCLEQGLALCRGELLPGFHLSETPQFERWLENARTRLQHRATQAAWALADEEQGEGRPIAAARWARRAMALDPYHEAGVRKLVALLERSGCRAEAVQAYEQFSRRLMADLDLEPSAETRALIETIRHRERCASATMVTGRPPASPPAVPRRDAGRTDR
jgi:serine/threonine-protein kinase